MNWKNSILVGDCRELLARMPEQSVQCCVTSPPYFGLRDYGLPPLVWGGDDEACEHVWEGAVKPGMTGGRGSIVQESVKVEGVLKGGVPDSAHFTCTRCSAWRGGLGLEPTPDLFVQHLVEVFRAVWRVLRDDGTVWLNLGNSYASSSTNQSTPVARGGRFGNGDGIGRVGKHSDEITVAHTPGIPPGLKPKDLCGMPWRVAFALQADGWYLRSAIVWAKGLSFCPQYAGSVMPESATDRPTSSYEMVFLLTKKARYFYDNEAVREKHADPTASGGRTWGSRLSGNEQPAVVGKPREYNPAGRNLRNVWAINPVPYSGSVQTSRLVHVGRGAFCDGMMHIVSPNCPVHGGLFDLVAMPVDGECEGDWLTHIAYNGSHPVQVPEDDCALFRPLRACCYEGQNLDCWLLDYARAAIDRNTGIRRKAHALATKPSCTPCAQRTARIARRLAARGLSEQGRDIFESNIWPDAMDARLSGQMICRTLHKSSWRLPPKCTCPVYQKRTEKASHFATFPPALVTPCIKAGTSERGACAECGAPWERVVERIGGPPRGTHVKNFDTRDNPHGRPGGDTRPYGSDLSRIYAKHGYAVHHTTGWRPTCSCADNRSGPSCGQPSEEGRVTGGRPPRPATVPCVVLDPFMGAGTTALVAQRMGRGYVGMELSEDYARQARKRLERRGMPLFQQKRRAR